MRSPVKPVTFGQGMKISLDHYYDILKAKVEDKIGEEEYLQLSLASSIIDLSPEPERIPADPVLYHWHSKYNLIRRCDRTIDTTAVDGEIVTTQIPFTDTYERFLDKLLDYAEFRELTAAEQQELSETKLRINSTRRDLKRTQKLDRAEWTEYAELNGIEPSDAERWYTWSLDQGYFKDMNDFKEELRHLYLKKQTILDKRFADPDDKDIAEAAIIFDRSLMGYPIHPDSLYRNGRWFDPSYLASTVSETDSLFERRPVVGFNPIFKTIIDLDAGAFEAEMNRTTSESKSIQTDWSAGASARYGFIRVRASASEHRAIQEDFEKATGVKVSAKAVFPIDVNFPWLRPSLFKNKRVLENLADFESFFGENGSLRYYPTKTICLRGMSVEFESSQNWSYNYKRQFSASGGGGFGAFGITFGGRYSYSKNVEEHKVDKAGTKLTVKDGERTLRFAGFVVQRNTVWDDNIEESVKKWIDFDAV